MKRKPKAKPVFPPPKCYVCGEQVPVRVALCEHAVCERCDAGSGTVCATCEEEDE